VLLALSDALESSHRGPRKVRFLGFGEPACATVETLGENNSCAPIASAREAGNLEVDRNPEKEKSHEGY